MKDNDNLDPVDDQSIDYSQDCQKEDLPEGGYVSINPEFSPYKNSIMQTGRFHIYMVHPAHGTATFYITHDENCCWKGEVLPPFVDEDLLEWIGDKIERHNH